MEKKIALIQNDAACYSSLIYFLKQIAKVLEKAGYQTEVIGEIDDSFMQQKWSAVVGINQNIFSAQFEDESFIFDYLECPLFSLIVDPPYFHDQQLRKHPKNLHLICLDEGHVEYAKEIYGPFANVKMGYLLGEVEKIVPWEKRNIDILFTGTATDVSQFVSKVNSYSQSWVKDLFAYLVELGAQHPENTTEKYVLRYFKEKGMTISKEDMRLAMATAGYYAEFFLRGYFRQKVVRTLLENEITVTVVGNGWEKLKSEFGDKLILHTGVNFKEVAQFNRNAKIILNVMPWFKAGCHDRVPTSMLQGAVCLTDESEYLKKVFCDGEDIVFYQLDRLADLSKSVFELQQDTMKAKKIAERGLEIARNDFSWNKMVQDTILQFL